jgi:hypothetical protein
MLQRQTFSLTSSAQIVLIIILVRDIFESMLAPITLAPGFTFLGNLSQLDFIIAKENLHDHLSEA